MAKTLFYDISELELEIKKEKDFLYTLIEIKRSVKKNRLTLESRIFYQETVDRLERGGLTVERLGTYHSIF